MSNRFHSKWHRRNHHTYTNPTNPDAGHDPIASQQQPFLGEFVLFGTLSCWAPLSSYAGGFFSNNTSLCAIAGYRGLFVQAPRVGMEIKSNSLAISAYSERLGMSIDASIGTTGRAISATASNIGLDIWSNNVAISAQGNRIAIEAESIVRAISAYGGFIGGEFASASRAISAYSPYIAGEFGSASTAISAQGSRVGIEVYSRNDGISAYGGNVGIEVYSPFRAISAFGNTVALEAYSYQNAISAFSNTLGAYIYSSLTGTYVEGMSAGAMISSPMVSLSTGGGGYNVLNSRTGIYCIPMEKDVVGTPFTPVLAVNGNSYFDGGVTITGDLSTLGRMSYLDTKVVITSSLYIENKGTDAAATVIQEGAQPILVCYDKDVSLGIASFIVDGATSGNVGINTTQAQLVNSAKLSIIGNAATNGKALSAVGEMWVEGEVDLNVTGNSNTNINTTTPSTTVTVGQDGATPTNINVNGNTTVLGTTQVNRTGSKNTSIGNASSTTTIDGPTNVNASINSNTNINTGTSTGTATIGNASATVVVAGDTSVNNNVNDNTNINTGTSTGTATIGNASATVVIAGDTSINASINDETKINTGTSTGNVSIGGNNNSVLLYSPITSAVNDFIVSNSLSARTVSQKTFIYSTTSVINIDITDAAYQVYPINTTTTINYINITPGRTIYVVLSNITPSVQTLNPNSSYIYLNSRPITLAASKVGLMEIVTFGNSTSSVLIKYTAQP